MAASEAGIVFALFLSILCIGTSLWLMGRHFPLGRHLRPGVLHFTYLFHLFAQNIPAFFFLADIEKPAALNYFLACSVASLLIPVGGIITNKIFSGAADTSPGNLENLQNATDPVLIKKSWVFAIILSAIGASIFWFYIKKVSTPPLFEMLLGTDIKSVMDSRLAAAKAGYIYGQARLFLMPFLCLLTLLCWKNIQSIATRMLMTAVFLMGLFYNAYNTEKMPVAMIFVLICIAIYYSIPVDKQNIQSVFTRSRILTVVGILAAATIYPLLVFLHTPSVVGQGILYTLKNGFFDRIFLRPAINAYYSFEVFPDFYPYTCFQDVQKLTQLMDWKMFRLSEEIAFYKFGTIMNAPAPGIGGFYAQAGWIGVITGTLFAAMLYRFFEMFLLSRPRRTAIEMALYVILLYTAFRFCWSGFHNIFYTESMVPIAIIYGGWILFQKLPFPQKAT